jgi:cytoskeleton protein RodZ
MFPFFDIHSCLVYSMAKVTHGTSGKGKLMGELGDRLRKAREAKGLTLEQIEEVTRIRRRYLQALEEEDFGQLPGEVFVRGFLRNYALALGLDPEEVLAAGGLKVPSPLPPAQEQPVQILDEPLAAEPGRQWMLVTGISLMVLIAVGLAGWTLWRYLGPASATPQPSATATVEASATATRSALAAEPGIISTPSPTPTATEEPTVTRTPATGVLIHLEATARSWVRIIVDGRLAYEGNLEAGQAQEWTGNSQVFVRTGNAGGLRIWYNGHEEPSLGRAGEVVERTWGAGTLPEGTELPVSESTPGPVGPPPSSPTPTPTVPATTPTASR